MSKPYGCVYVIRNLRNNKVYVGQTIDTLKRRWQGHLQGIKRTPEVYFTRALAKYGAAAFVMTREIDAYSKEHLDFLEKTWIHALNSANNKFGYNSTYGGEGAPQTQETRLKMSASQRRRMSDPDERERIAASLRGKTLSDEHKLKVGLSGIGRKFSDECIAKRTEKLKLLWADPVKKAEYLAKRGPRTPEHCKKLSLSQIGKVYSPETIARMSAASKGRVISPETREKIRIGLTAALKAKKEARERELMERAA